MSTAQILVVEDEPIVAKSIQTELECMGYSVPTTASTGEEAVSKAEDMHPDLVLMDIVLRGRMDGIEAAETIRSRFDIPIVYLTAYQDKETLGRAKITEPFGYLLKPYEERELLTTIEMALYKHRMEQKVKSTERWLAATVQSLAEGVIATDAHLAIRLMNPKAESLTGWSPEDAFGKDLSEVCNIFQEDEPTALESLAAKAIREGSSLPLPAESLLIAQNGHATPIEGSVAPITDDEGNPTGVVLTIRDVSDRKQLERVQRQSEAHRRRSEKMEAVSRLAGGVAHDFNNLLTAILGNTSLAISRLPRDHPCMELLASAEAAAERAAVRIRQLLGVSGQAFLRMKPVDLGAMLRDMEGAIQKSMPPQVALELTVNDDLWTVQADPSQLREAITNLCQNAEDAMPSGGRLTIQGENAVVPEDHNHVHPEAHPGEYVRLRIQDMGAGIPPEMQSKIFEPFFSTKNPEQSAGLGLALAAGIVEQQHGWIECVSEPLHGTRFDVYLPRYAHPNIAPPAPVPFTRSQRNSTTTILIADDEPMVRELGKTILEGQGYNVLLAEDGAEAVSQFQENRLLIDLVILDLTMPRLSGNDACKRMLEIDPGVRVLFSSGYFAEQLISGEDRIVGFIQKPYRQADLIKSVRSALEQAGVTKRDILLMLVKRLEQAVADDWTGKERSWAHRVMLVLDRVEQLLGEHLLVIDDPDESPVDASRARRMVELRAKYSDFLEIAGDLKTELHRTEQTVRPAGTASGSSASPSGPTALEMRGLSQKLTQFREALEKLRQQEINLVMEAVTTDIGAGD